METLTRDEALLAAQCESNETTDRAEDEKWNGKQTFKRYHQSINIQLEGHLHWRTPLPTKNGYIYTHI